MDRKLCEEFARNPRANPLTGRKIDVGGPTHRRIAALCAKYRPGGAPSPPAPRPKDAAVTRADCEKFAKDDRFNPVTGRSIAHGGATWKKLAKACGERSPKRPSPARKSPIAAKRKCLPSGLRQLSGTCWFNTGLNALVLGGRAGAFFERLAGASKVPESAHFANGAACPRKLTKDTVLGYMRRVFRDDFSATPGGRYARNHAARMIGKLGDIPGITEAGGNPAFGLRKILGVALPKTSYAFVPRVSDVGIAGPGVRFAAVLPREDSYFAWGYSPPPYIGDFHLDSVALALMFKTTVRGETKGHAVVGFFCGGKPYVFDSNRRGVLQLDWYGAMTSKSKLTKLWKALNENPDGSFRYGGLFQSVKYPFYLYSR